MVLFFFSSRRRHTRSKRDWSSDVCSSDLHRLVEVNPEGEAQRVQLVVPPAPAPAATPVPTGEAEPPCHGGELGGPVGRGRDRKSVGEGKRGGAGWRWRGVRKRSGRLGRLA